MEKRHFTHNPTQLSKGTPSPRKDTKECSGVKDLPIDLPNPDQCPDPSRFFEWQVQEFISQVELPSEMYQWLNSVTLDVESIFQEQLPGCRALIFGSCGSTLAFMNSDVDIFLQCIREQPKDFVRREAKLMYRSSLFNVLARIPCARVPIVKFQHRQTGWQGDLTVSSRLGVCNSRLIRFLISLDPRIRPLIMVVKYWAKVCGITGSNNKLTTYATVMLVIFYLQTLSPPLLPSVATLQKLSAVEEFNQGWKCSFCDEEWTVSSECLTGENKMSLKELLVGFFNFYKSFDYSYVICPLLSCSIPVSDFENPHHLPEEMHRYQEKIETDRKMAFKTNVMLKVQDPFELNINITKNVTDKVFSMFVQACKLSCELSESSDDSCLLESLFSIQSASLDTSEEVWKFYIPLKTPVDTETELDNWYQLTTDAVLLVMKEVLKLNLEPSDIEVSSKVKKLESSKDVHTLPNNFKSCDNLVYTCSGNADVTSSRKKTSKLLNKLNVQNLSLSVFEREVCISNALYRPKEASSFTFNLFITSLDKFKTHPQGIELLIKDKKKVSGEVGTFLRRYLQTLVLQAALFITKANESNSVTEVKESLKELFNLMVPDVPDATESKSHNSDLLDKKCPSFSKIEKEGKSSRFPSTSSITRTNQCVRPKDKKCLVLKETTSQENYIENQEVKSLFSPSRNISDETQSMIDDFLKPTDCDGKNSGKPNKFFSVLENIRKCETQSSFTSDNENPFLKSIEKVSLKALHDENKTNDDNKAGNSRTEDEDVIIIEKENEKSPEINIKSSEKKMCSDDCDSLSDGKASSDVPRPSEVQIHQRPSVYIERPHKFRKPVNYKSCPPISHRPQGDTCGFRGHRTNNMRPYPQGHPRQSYSSGESSDFQRHNKALGLDDNYFSGGDKHQRKISRSCDKHREWYPTLFK